MIEARTHKAMIAVEETSAAWRRDPKYSEAHGGMRILILAGVTGGLACRRAHASVKKPTERSTTIVKSTGLARLFPFKTSGSRSFGSSTPLASDGAWGTDWIRKVGMLKYKQRIEAFRVTDRLFDSVRAALMGDTLHRVYN